MTFNTGAALLDAIVLAVVSKEPEGTYGYRITQEVRQVIELSESTLYPVLRRLQKDDCLEVYDKEFGGRNRRYYKTTGRGWAQLTLYESEWRSYAEKVSGLLSSNGSSKLDAGGNKNLS
jgi:PadR family transcriptional regulator PadR